MRANVCFARHMQTWANSNEHEKVLTFSSAGVLLLWKACVNTCFGLRELKAHAPLCHWLPLQPEFHNMQTVWKDIVQLLRIFPHASSNRFQEALLNYRIWKMHVFFLMKSLLSIFCLFLPRVLCNRKLLSTVCIESKSTKEGPSSSFRPL